MRISALLASTAIVAIQSGLAIAADAPIVLEQPAEARFESKPAVSAINGSLELSYTFTDIDNASDAKLLTGAGSISIPVGHSFGLQFDAGVGRFSADQSATGYGIAAHAFWRDPDVALLGLYGDYQTASGFDVNSYRLGVEAELYLDRISLEGFAGAERIDLRGKEGTYFSAEALAAFYVTDNVRVHGGVGHGFEKTYGVIGAEAMMPFASNNVALFADGTFSGKEASVRGGVRVYFGEEGKSLIARHREDDPRLRLFDSFSADIYAGEPDVVPPSNNDGAI
jgi:hypothetical protein